MTTKELENAIGYLHQVNNKEPFLVFTEDFFKYFLEQEFKRECDYLEIKDIEKNFNITNGYVGKWYGTSVYVLPKGVE